MKKKVGVLMIQLGTPDSPKVSDVRSYLSEFLNDKRVIDLPWLGRKILVNGIIVPFRAPKSAKVYKELWEHGKGESPLLTYSKSITEQLNTQLNPEGIFVHLGMRYKNPHVVDALIEMRKKNYDEIIILPLFPQYASATNGSAIDEALRVIRNWWVIPNIKIISQFWDEPGYIDQFVQNAQKFDLKSYDHICFSYHGLPIRQVDKVYEEGLCSDHKCEHEITSDNKFCYKATCFATTRMIAEKLGLKDEDYTVCFQSRLTKNWIEPYADQVVVERAKKGDKRLLFFSPAFVADCLETIIEIGEEYQELFEEFGGEKVDLVESCNAKVEWVATLAQMIQTKSVS
ncbi:MAG: ferrochelatase [Crocinitomicaceae bacterium]